MKEDVLRKIKTAIIKHSQLKNAAEFNDVLDSHEHSFCLYTNSKYSNVFFVISKEEVWQTKTQVKTKLNLYAFDENGKDVDFDASGINLNEFIKESVKHCEIL